LNIFEIAEKENIPTHTASNRLAEKRIKDMEETNESMPQGIDFPGDVDLET